MLFRHGDVLIKSINEIPRGAKKISTNIIVRGEITGHAHQIVEDSGVQLYRDSDFIYIEVSGNNATIIHEEHKPIKLRRGKYKTWVQREYTPEKIERVQD